MKRLWKVMFLFLLIIVIVTTNHMLSIEKIPKNMENDVPTQVVILVISTPTTVITPTAIPTQTLEPVPTEIPFSVLAPTVLMSTEELTYDSPYVCEQPNPPPAGTYKMIENVYWQFITVLEKDENGEFTVPVRYMICGSGTEATPTPIGSFQMEGYKTQIIQSEHHSARYATHLTGTIYFHSILYDVWDDLESCKEPYNQVGTRVSHGCIRLWVPDAKWIFYNIAPGTEVEIIEGDKDDKEAATIRAQLVFPEDPNNINPDVIN